MDRRDDASAGKAAPAFGDGEVRDYERRRYRGWDQKLVDAREKKIIRRLLEGKSRKGAFILDVPSGYGRFSGLLGEEASFLVSCDLSLSMVKRTLERQGKKEGHAGIVADATGGLPFKTGAFDGVCSMRFFHHLHREEDRRRVLDELARVSSEWVILSFYRANFLHRLQRWARKKMKKSRTRIKMVPGKAFREEIRAAGFQAEKTQPLFRGIHAQHILSARKAE